MKSQALKKMMLGVLLVAVVAPFNAKAADAEARVELWKVETQQRILDAKDQAAQEEEQIKLEHEQTLKEAQTIDAVIASNS